MSLARIYDWAQSQPDKPAMIFHDLPVSYGDFARIIERAAHLLAGRGIPRSGTVAVLVSNLADGWMLLMALRRLGVTTISVVKPEALAALRLPDLSAIVTTTAEAGHHALPETQHPGVPRYIMAGDMYHIAGTPIPPPLAAMQAGGHIIYTSGTTGRYKQVLVDGPDEAFAVTRTAALSGLSPATLHHGMDLGIRTAAGYRVPLAVWHAGGTVVFDQRPDRFRRFFNHPVTQAYLPGPWVRDLIAAHPKPNPQPGFRLAFTSGFLSAALAADMKERFSAKISVIYAATELATRVMASAVEGPDDLHWLTVTPGRLIEVADDEDRPCPPDIEGNLRIRIEDGDARAYVADPEASATAFRDGFFYPGDRAVTRADGRIRVLGRIADLLNIDGRKLACSVVEPALLAHLQLADTEICLFSGLGADGEEELVLAVESARRLDEAAIAAAAADFMNGGHVRIVVLPDFPRTETRKVRRAEVRKMLF